MPVRRRAERERPPAEPRDIVEDGHGAGAVSALTSLPSSSWSVDSPAGWLPQPVGTVVPVTELRVPWRPEARAVLAEGRGELFVRHHRHADPAAPTVLLLHGWTASSDLQFFTAYEAIAERFSFVGIDHRGHGRGLRSPDPFTLEDAADDAAAAVRQLVEGPVVVVGYSMGGPIALHLTRRHADLVAGLVVEATALEWRGTWRERALWRVLPIAGSWLRTKGYRRYVNRSAPRLLGADGDLHPVAPYVPWMVSEMARNDPFAMVDAGRALSQYDARPWAPALGVPAGSLITTRDHIVRPAKQWAMARALGAEVRELAADHLAAVSHPVRFAELTVELIGLVAARAGLGDAPSESTSEPAARLGHVGTSGATAGASPGAA